MPSERIRYRVEYAGQVVYCIIASSNVQYRDSWYTYFKDKYVENNGVASIFMNSEKAPSLQQDEKNVYIPNGDASMAMDAIIKKLDQINNSTPLFITKY